MDRIIGRKQEIEELRELYHSGRAEFVAVYGRRRVGKTYLIDETLGGHITFRHAGLSPVDDNNQKNMTKDQLQHFYHSLLSQGMKKSHQPTSWLEAFYMLQMHLQSVDDGSRQVVFIDELPWMDTPRSKFVMALEGFWNGWACHRHNLMLVVCGSANSWMLDNLVNMCEMKFYGDLFSVTKTYERKLVHRQILLSEMVNRRTVIHPILITTYGLTYNEYSGAFVHTLTLDELFQ